MGSHIMAARQQLKEIIEQSLDGILRHLDPQGTGVCDVMELHDAMTTEQLDLRSEAIQAFSQDCHTSTSGQVDYTKYLARRGNPARGGGSSARGGSSESSRTGSQK